MMAGISNKTVQASVRIPNKELVLIDAYANDNEITRSQAILSLIRKGLDKTESEPATKADLVAFAATIERAIASQPIAIQENPAPIALPESEEQRYEKTIFGLYRRKKKDVD